MASHSYVAGTDRFPCVSLRSSLVALLLIGSNMSTLDDQLRTVVEFPELNAARTAAYQTPVVGDLSVRCKQRSYLLSHEPATSAIAAK
jgi:hypothetical protein